MVTTTTTAAAGSIIVQVVCGCGRGGGGGAHGPGVEWGDAGFGEREVEEEEGGRGQRGEAEEGDEEGGGAEEREEVRDGGEERQGEEEDLVLLVGGCVLLCEGLDEVFLLWTRAKSVCVKKTSQSQPLLLHTLFVKHLGRATVGGVVRGVVKGASKACSRVAYVHVVYSSLATALGA